MRRFGCMASFKDITNLQNSLKQIKDQCFTRKDKCDCKENGFVHYHCTKCDFVTRKGDARLQKHWKTHTREKSLYEIARDNYFRSYSGNCPKNCRYKALELHHFHCKLCSWGIQRCDKRLADHLYKTHSIHVEKSSILPISSVETTDNICPSNTLTMNADHSTSEVIDGASNSVNTETSSVLSVSTKRLKTNNGEDTDQSGVITSEVLVDSPWQRQVRDGRLKERHNEGAYRSLFPSSHDHDLVQTDDPIQTEEDSTQLGHYDSENTVDVGSSMLEINSLIGLTSTPYPFPVAEDLNSSDNTTTFQVQPWQISDDSPLPTAECVVCSEQDQSKLRSCRILKEKRGKKINWTATILLAFYHKINVDIVEESLICNKHYSQWYRFYEKNRGYVTDLFPVSGSHTPNIGDTCQVSVMKSILPQVSLPADRSLSSSTLDVVYLVTAPSHNMVIDTSGGTVLEIIVGAKLGMLSTSDILSISAVNKSFRQKQVIWKHLCIRKFGIYRCFNDVSYKETFLRIIQERLQLEKELDICIPENKMSIREFQCYLSKSFVDQLKPNSELQTLLRDEGISRIPKNSELLVFIAAKMLRRFLDQQASCTRNCKATFDTSGVRLGAEYYRIPLTERIYDTVLTSTRTERQKTLSAAKSAEKVWRKVIMHGIRLQSLNKDNITPLHRVMTQVFSNFHSPELLTIGNKSGLSLSYTNDYLYNKKARASYEENCETFLNSVDSNVHFWNIDNLETVMKWMNMLKEGDKLTHFMTAMLVYIKGHQQITDFYPKRREHTLSKSQLKPTEKDENIFTEFCEVVYQYANKLNDVVPEGAEQYIESLSKSSTNEQSTSNEQKSKCPKIDKEALPRKRILHESFEGNLYGNRNVKTTLHYHRVLELYSGDMFQVKRLVDTLMKDYGIQKVKPLPCPENHPPSPMLFASVPTQLADGETQAPAFLYRNIWGVIENTTEIISAADQDLVKDETKVSKILESIAGQLQTDKLAIHSALQVLSLIEEGVLKAQSQLYLLRAELYRKQGLFLAASENYMTFLNCENDRAGTTNVEYVTCAKVNLAIAKYKLGLIHHTVSICNELMTNAQSYVQLSVCLLLACCYIAEDKNWLKALEYVETANCILIGLFPADDTIHSKHGFLKNNMAILNFLNGNKDASLSLITTSIKIVAETYGQQSFEYVAASMNYIILHFAVYHDGEAVSEKLKDTQKLLRDLDPKANLAIYQDTVGAIEQFITHTEENCKLSDVCGNTNIWKLCNFNLFDYPFGWIDFAPVNHSITLGSDSQVWEHVEKIRHTWPFRYQWLSMTWLGEFHKLKNHHLRLKKRYLDFHIREHVRHYLNDATTNKLDKFLRMDDFDATNDFFYCDLIAGLTELALAVKTYETEKANSVERQQQGEHVPAAQSKPVETFSKFLALKNYCNEFAKNESTLQVALKYLFEDNIYTVAYLESQKFGNLRLNHAVQKKCAPLNFTTNARHYGPDYIGHICNIELLRNYDLSTAEMIWTINEQEESGHRRSEDQGLEATMNCAVKNDCKVFSPLNVINRSATVQERETAQKNLKEELFIQYGQKHPSHQKINIERILILRALWRKYFSQVFNFYISSSSEEGASIDMEASAITSLSNQPTSQSPSSLHDKHKSLNVDILKEKELGESAVSNFIDVKVLQRGGWGFSNPPMKEIKTIKGQTNKRQKESMFRHQQKRVDELTQLLITQGINPKQSDEALPMQLLRNDGSLYFTQKADLMKHLYQMYPDAFITGDTLRQHTKNYKEVVAIFTDMMFKFRQIHKKGILRLEDICKIQAAACVKKTKEKYGTPNKILHIHEVFDRRADRTKGATEQKRGDAPPTALDFSTLIDIDFSEKIPNYSSQWRDREFGRKKLTTAYSTYFKKRENVTSLNLWDGVRHVITGGVGNLCTAYDVTKGIVRYLDHNNYNCLHPEADTGVFYSLKAFIDQHGSANPNTTVIIDCPETDCINIVLYKYNEIKSLLHSHQLKLFCKLHDQLIEVATGKKAKASSKRKTLTDQTIEKQEFYLDFAKLGELISSDDSYKDLQYPQESLGVLSIVTGNDKIPAFRSCTKTMALNQFRKQCSEGRILDLVNPQTVQFDDTDHCKYAYRLIIFMMYHHLYRTSLRKLGLMWNSFISGNVINLDLLKEVGIRHCKGKEVNYVPTDPVLSPSRLRGLYQTHEYDQIFVFQPSYLDPLLTGYTQVGPYLFPMLNERCDIINNTISPTPVIIDDSNPNDTTEREEGGNDIEDQVDSEPDDFEYSNGAYEDNSISERIIENNEKSNDIIVDYYSDVDTDENCMYFDDSESEDDTDVRNPYLL